MSKTHLSDILSGAQWSLGKSAFECVTSPLQSVFNLVREVLQGADGNGLLRGVLRGAVGLGEIRNNYLSVALSAESTRLQKGQPVKKNFEFSR